MKNESRTNRSIINILVGIISYALIVLIGLVTRRVLTDTMGLSIVGVNGEFTAIISMLSLTELGIGTAIIFHMYKPLAENDQETIISLMQAYSKIYKIIALVVLILGVSLTPFLQYWIKEQYDYVFLTSVFLLMVLDVVVTYLFAYKRSIINADQNGFKVTIISTISNILLNISKIIILLVSKNYILFLLVSIIFHLGENIIISMLADKMYPYLKTKKKIPLAPGTKRGIKSTVKAVGLHYIGMYFINGCDNIVISSILGSVIEGIYSNYYTIIIAFKQLLTQITQGIIPSFGNMLVKDNKEKAHLIFMDAMFINFIIVNFVSISLYICLNPFVKLWIPNRPFLGMDVVLILVINFYFEGISEMLGSVRASAGLFGPDRWLHILLAILNLIISIPLTHRNGIVGVFIGTLICYIIKNIVVLPNIVYRNIFDIKVSVYYKKLFIYCLSTFVFACITQLIVNIVPKYNGILDFVISAVICCIVPNLLVLIFYFKTKEFAYLLKIVNVYKNKLLKR